jgi:hypothetical protein
MEEGLTRLPDVEEFAIAQDVPDKEEEIRILSYVGLKWINENRARLSDPACEVPLEVAVGGFELRGTADVVDVRADTNDRVILEIWDYKTGQRSDAASHRQQMTAYAYLALSNLAPNYKADMQIIVRLLWLRDQEVSVLVFTPAELLEWAEDLPRRVTWDGKTYTPGDACRYCPRVATCPGRLQLYRSGIEALSDTTGIVPYDGGLPADPARWGRAIVQARLLKTFVDDFLRSSVIAVELAGGEIPLPSGQKIVLKTRAGSASLDSAATIQWLRDKWGLSDDELAQFVSIKKSGVEKFIGSKAERGEKGKLIQETLATFEEDGILKRGKPARWVDIIADE